MSTALSRRKAFEAGGGVLAAAAFALGAQGAHAAVSAASHNEMVLQKWFNLWVDSRDWSQFDAMMTDDFTFTAASGEDHISKTEFKHECWDNQIGHIKAFEFEAMMAKGDQVFVKYLGHTTGGHTFRNVELHRVRNGKIASIECYFGSNMSFPTGVDAKKS